VKKGASEFLQAGIFCLTADFDFDIVHGVVKGVRGTLVLVTIMRH
jgi:hypothetical protein